MSISSVPLYMEKVFKCGPALQHTVRVIKQESILSLIQLQVAGNRGHLFKSRYPHHLRKNLSFSRSNYVLHVNMLLECNVPRECAVLIPAAFQVVLTDTSNRVFRTYLPWKSRLDPSSRVTSQISPVHYRRKITVDLIKQIPSACAVHTLTQV